MNTFKLQTDVMKEATKESSCMLYYPGDCETWILINNSAALVLHDCLRLIDIDRVCRGGQFTALPRLLDSSGYNPATKVHCIFEHTIGRKTVKLRKIYNDSLAVYVDENNLKYFDSDATFAIKNDHSVVYVYECGHLCGLVIPVKVDL